jgi:hydrogenase 3 maturation protease
MNLDSVKAKITSFKEKIISAKSKFSRKFKNFSKKVRKKTIKKTEMKEVDKIFKEFTPTEFEFEKYRFAILGIGNDLKGDDGIGWYVVDKIKEKLGKDDNLLLVKTSVPENHVKEISEFAPKMLIIIDAADFKKGPGSMKIIKESQITKSFVSTHTTPLTLFLRLYQADQLVKRPVLLIGIQRKSNDFGQLISRPVRKSGDRIAKLISKLYKKNVLDLRLEREFKYLSNPFMRVKDYFKKE